MSANSLPSASRLPLRKDKLRAIWPMAGVAVVLIYVLLRGVFLTLLVPPWQGPDEPGHMEYILQLARDRQLPTHADLGLQSLILQSMEENDFYRLVGAEPPAAEPEGFADLERLGTDNTQVGNESPVGYLPHAAVALATVSVPAPSSEGADALGQLEAALLCLRLVNVVLAVLTVAAIAWAAALTLGPASAPAAAALAAAAPMLGFGGAIVNNDLTAALLAALWFGVLVRTLRMGPSGGRIATLAAIGVTAGLAKRTGLYLTPLMLLIALVAVWRKLRSRPKPRVRLDPSLMKARPVRAALGPLLVAAVVLVWPIQNRPSGWERTGRPWGAERSSSAARTGHWGLHIEDDQPEEWQYLEQTVAVEDGGPIVAGAWLRSDEPGTRAQLVVNDDRGTWLGETTTLDTEWQPVSASGNLAPGARWVRIAIVPGEGTSAGSGALDADDLFLGWQHDAEAAHFDYRESLAETGRSSPYAEAEAAEAANLLSNPGAEAPLRVGSPLLAAALRYTDARRLSGAFARAFSDPSDTASEGWRGIHFLFHSFWGGFGWLTIWPRHNYFNLAAVLTLFVLSAQLVALVRPRALASADAVPEALRICAVASSLAIGVAVIGLMAGASWERLPQGRYLIAALVPLTVPAVALADRLLPRRGPIALAAYAITLDLAALAEYVWPAYRGL